MPDLTTQRQPGANPPLDVSVIIPARNEAGFIKACLASVNAQQTSCNYEVLVVDNGSADNTADIAARNGARVLRENRVGLPAAREKGRLSARGRYLLYIDADTRMPSNYIDEVMAAIRRHPTAVAFSNPFKFYDGTLVLQILIWLYFHVLYRFQARLLKLLGASNQVIGGSFTVKADTLAMVGGFNTAIKFFGEDTELSKRLGQAGPVVFIRQLRVATSARRFRLNGVVVTSWLYIRNYFAMALLDRPANHQTGRLLLRVMGLASAILFVERLWVRYGYLARHRVNQYGYRYWLAQADRHETLLAWLLAGSLTTAVLATVLPRLQLFGETLNRIFTTEKLLALTFDDGPDPLSTPAVLTILRRYKVPATFFVIGQRVTKAEPLVKQIKDAGHELAIHSYKHNFSLPFRSRYYIAADLRRTATAVQKAARLPSPPTLYRPPHGWRTPWMLQAVAREGCQTVLWDIITTDFIGKTPASLVTRRITGRLRPGSIIVLHDAIAEQAGADRSNLLMALPKIIEEAQARGYRFVRLGDFV